MKWEDFFILVTMPFVIIAIAIMLLLQTGCTYTSKAHDRFYDINCSGCEVNMKFQIDDGKSKLEIQGR